jgi:hypothetical protein
LPLAVPFRSGLAQVANLAVRNVFQVTTKSIFYANERLAAQAKPKRVNVQTSLAADPTEWGILSIA